MVFVWYHQDTKDPFSQECKVVNGPKKERVREKEIDNSKGSIHCSSEM